VGCGGVIVSVVGSDEVALVTDCCADGGGG
jgi:hypothetical protein